MTMMENGNHGNSNHYDPAMTVQQIDRLVNASTPSDSLESLQSLITSLRSVNATSVNNDSPPAVLTMISTIAQSEEFTTALCSLLSSSELGSMTVEDGDSTASELFSQILTSLSSNSSSGNGTARDRNQCMSIIKQFLHQPSEGRLIHSILDLLSSKSTSLSARTNALNIISQLIELSSQSSSGSSSSSQSTNSKLLQTQILSAPDGIHRIIDLLSSSDHEESIRNEAILLCTNLAKTSSAAARLMIFSETYEKVFEIAKAEYQQEQEIDEERMKNGVSGGSGGSSPSMIVVEDCLQLCVEMTKQDGMGSEVFLGSANLVNGLAEFLDLRFGRRFKCARMNNITLYNSLYSDNDDTSRGSVAGGGGGNQEDDADDEEDLDTILGNTTSKKATDETKIESVAANEPEEDTNSNAIKIPYLVKQEAKIVELALALLQILITGDESSSNDSSAMSSANKTKRESRQRSILSHKTLSCLLFDMALYTLPPPDAPLSYYVSAIPPLEIQLKALDVVSAFAHDSIEDITSKILQKPSLYLQNVGFLDRLMYLICTGGDIGIKGETKTKAVKISMHALGVLRCVLSAKEASIMMLHTIAPLDDIGEGLKDPASQQDIPVVQKLVNTLGENLHMLNRPEFSENIKEDKKRMYVNIIGAAGALSVFLTNGAGETTREMLLRIALPPPPQPITEQNDEKVLLSDKADSSPLVPNTLVESILLYLEDFSNRKVIDSEDINSHQVALALLRLLVEWVPSTPKVISSILSSASSVALGVLLQKKKGNLPSVQALAGLLLGLCMEHMEAEEEVGGWSRSSIMNLINVGLGISKFTQLLEGMKPIIISSEDNLNAGPWTCCKWERKVLMEWYEQNVNIIRRRAVQELTLTNSVDDDSSSDSGEENEDIKVGNKDFRSLGKLVSQQSSELEMLRQKLADSQDALGKQASEMNMWKKRMESNPTQLDDLLNEYSSKIVDLESDIKLLKDDSSKRDEDHKDCLDQKGVELSKIQGDLELSREETEAMQREIETIKEEMTGLSSAYTNLETEYNRVLSGNDNSSPSDQKGETVQEGLIQSNGNISAEEQSTAASDAMRSENEKLKNDIRAANNWMNMAVKKMDKLSKQNLELEHELKSLNSDENRAGTVATNTPEESVISTFEAKLKEKDAQIQTLNERIHETKLQLSEVGQSNTDETEKLVEEVKKLRDANKAAQDWMGNAMKQHDIMKRQLVEAKQLNLQLQAKQSSSQPERASPSKVSHLEAKVQELTTTREEVKQKLVNLEVQLEEKEKELIDSVTIEENESKRRKEEMNVITEKLSCQLETINSQEESIKALKIDLHGKEEELTKLKDEMTRICDSESFKENEYNKQTEEVSSLNKELLSRDDAIRTHQENISTLQNDLETKEEKVLELQEQIENMRESLNNIEGEKSGQKSEIDDLISEREDQFTAFAKIEHELETLQAENDNLISEREEHVSVIEQMRARINDFQSWTETAQQRISELESEKEVVDDKMKDLEEQKLNALEKAKSLSESLDTLKEEYEAKGNNDEIEKLQEEISDLKVEIGNLEVRNSALFGDNKVLEKEKAEFLPKMELLKDTEEKLFDRENQVAELEGDLAAARKDLTEANDQVEKVMLEWQEKCENMETTLEHKYKTALEQQEIKTAETITVWETKYSSICEDASKLAAKKEYLSSSLHDLQEKIAAKEVHAQGLENQLMTANCEKNKSEKAMVELESKLLNDIKQLEFSRLEYISTVDDLQLQLDERDEALTCAEDQVNALTEELVETRDQSEEVVKKWQENSEELEANIAELEVTIESQLTEANVAISQWEARCNELTERNETLEHELEQNDSSQKIASLELSCKQTEDELETATSKIIELQTSISLSEGKLRDFDAIKSDLEMCRNNANTLQVSNGDIHKQLKEVRENLQKEIAEKAQTEELLQRESDARVNLEKELSVERQHAGGQEVSQAELRQSKSLLKEISEKLEALEQEKIGLEKLYENEKNERTEQVREQDEEKRLLLQQMKDQSSEIQDLRSIKAQLECELQEADDALQSQFTDEVTVRATEMATKALRNQLKDVREKHVFEHDAFVAEKEARLLAEEEIERLRVDLSLLVQDAKDGELVDGKIRKLTSKAAEEIVRKDREEIEGLRNNIDRLTQELISCRAKERDAEERAANFRLNASVCEQELVAAKSDLSYLKQFVESLKVGETNLASSLQSRIKTLEDERAALILSNTNETESLKAEISQSQMDRDRLLHALNESEKANSTLVYSTTIQNGTDGSTSHEAEIVKLRIEKAQLLASISENGSKIERRIRSAVAADASSAETDLILEKELRESAELEIADLRGKCDELNTRLSRVGDVNLTNGKEAEMNHLKLELHSMQANLEKVREENVNVQLELEKVQENAKAESTRLREECQLANAKLREISREGDFETAVAAEVARIKLESSTHQSMSNGSVSMANGVEEKSNETNGMETDALKMYEFVQEQDEAIKEERTKYNDLLNEHEDLLALLAQRDLERLSLQAALSSAQGEEAVRQAEEDASTQFGKFVKI